jgi:hypothetical protein
MPFFKDGFDYFYLNALVFLANILFGYYHRRPVLVVASVICLAIMLYIKELDYNEHYVYLLDQIAMLGVLVPGLYLWITSEPHKRLVSGVLFLTAATFYLAGLFFQNYGHSPDESVREFWHFFMHILSTGGHFALVFEPAVLALSITKRV